MLLIAALRSGQPSWTAARTGSTMRVVQHPCKGHTGPKRHPQVDDVHRLPQPAHHINRQAFNDVMFSVEGRLVHHCILTARSLFFHRFFCGTAADQAVVAGSPGDKDMALRYSQQR